MAYAGLLDFLRVLCVCVCECVYACFVLNTFKFLIFFFRVRLNVFVATEQLVFAPFVQNRSLFFSIHRHVKMIQET